MEYCYRRDLGQSMNATIDAVAIRAGVVIEL
jgi:hypothetical protein